MKNKVIFAVSIFLLIIYILVLPQYHFLRGKSMYEKQDYVSAYNHLRKSYIHNEKNTDYRYYYIKTLCMLSPSLTVQKEIYEISQGDQKDSAEQIAFDKVNEWKNNISLEYRGNYIEQAPHSNGIIRWDEAKFPLKVYIIDKSGVSLPPYYYDEIKHALNQWQASSGFIKFKIADKAKDADIIIKITPTPKDICTEKSCRYVVGYTIADFNGKKLKQMNITLYSKDANGNFFSDKEIYNTVLHETGHALGIMGHSYSSDDLMYIDSSGSKNFYAPHRSSFQYLSSNDINTIRLLYKLLPDIINSETFDRKSLIYPPVVLGIEDEIFTRKVKEAKNYIKQAPDISGGYVDLAIAYSSLGKKREALNAINKAVERAKTNQEKYICYYNLAIIYFNFGSYDKALLNAEKAREYFYDEDLKNLIMQINHAKRK